MLYADYISVNLGKNTEPREEWTKEYRAGRNGMLGNVRSFCVCRQNVNINSSWQPPRWFSVSHTLVEGTRDLLLTNKQTWWDTTPLMGLHDTSSLLMTLLPWKSCCREQSSLRGSYGKEQSVPTIQILKPSVPQPYRNGTLRTSTCTCKQILPPSSLQMTPAMDGIFGEALWETLKRTS